MKGITAAVLAMLSVLYALVTLVSVRGAPNPVLGSNQQRIADSGSVFIATIILRRQQQYSKRITEPNDLASLESAP
jgi:hypothetical protein